ncbi:acyl-CoA dehydrogenase family protein [Aromatoleum aromaticum]|uniref:Acyl-CoA dehydrogenase oxidoreductase protein n=1 Tax=Aromatoleum aromaticum (strain DSM 19018 / LMG 30748 / EbN1) TaxID=76114 RepID=Q5P018_AROAE|nr:acyl-CoA dehydrogenase family protein [Aromatoleum aromaticum]NMG54840.1 pimeloyl-CoA dehydrogenase large subunit [Aromatoleum aromaticum]CAI09346.1 putative acyl-CoA dehydrogenase oxidoreductase protein [Aromatoleum aromaticum EbN1]
MKLQFSAEDEAFRQEVRSFVRAQLPGDVRQKVARGLRLERSDYVAWYAKLYERGWITPGWPVEHGGPGWTPVQRYIFDEETLLGDAPRIIASGINMLGPVLIAFGSEEQKRRHLPPIRRSEVWWAQGFSEPGAGSDLASMRTSAVRDGDHFIVNGHKIWTSYAHFCDWLFCLVRTGSGKPQESISFLLIDLKTPGITVRPIRAIDGGNDLNEVFLDDVRVPAENLIGEINKGWSYAKYLLGHERTSIAGVGASKQQLARLKRLAACVRSEAGGLLIEEPSFRTRIAAIEIDLLALEYTGLRMLSGATVAAAPGVDASLLKIRGTELRQAIYEMLVEVAGPHAVAFVEEALFLEHAGEAVGPSDMTALAANYLDSRKLSIYGGANEIQRNLAARSLLEL